MKTTVVRVIEDSGIMVLLTNGVEMNNWNIQPCLDNECCTPLEIMGCVLGMSHDTAIQRISCSVMGTIKETK